MSKLNMKRLMGKELFLQYGESLREHLDDFATNVSHEIELKVFADAAVAIVRFQKRINQPIPVTMNPPSDEPCPLTHGINISSEAEIVKPAEIERWTNLAAWLDSNNVICLILGRAGHE